MHLKAGQAIEARGKPPRLFSVCVAGETGLPAHVLGASKVTVTCVAKVVPDRSCMHSMHS